MKRTLPGLFVVLTVLTACAAPGGSPGESPDSSSPPASDGGSPGDPGAIDHPTGSEAILIVDSPVASSPSSSWPPGCRPSSCSVTGA